jgi:hypothetical protein
VVSPPSDSLLSGAPLYSAVTRQSDGSTAAIRGTLFDANTQRAAAHARVIANLEDGVQATGIADAGGQFLVALPYPELSESFTSSPAVPGGENALLDGWPISVEVSYEPLRLQFFRPPRADDDAPDLVEFGSILNQAPANIWLSRSPFSESTQLSSVLLFGRELVLRTDDDWRLWVTPTSSPN